MKFIFTLFMFALAQVAVSQWSDTSNTFTDSMHMQVTTAIHNQQHPFIVRSYPDSGYFVVWQDSRNDAANSKSAIYAQKYSKAGVALWAANGVAMSGSSNNQHYTYQGQDYRGRSFAATDSAGGFYIAYADDSVTNYVYQRACVQHVNSNGNTVFGGPGNIISSSTTPNLNISPQLIADGNSGFFFSFIQGAAVVYTPIRVFIYCYKDVGGTLQNYGGGQMNENAIQRTASSPCGNYTYLQNYDAEIDDYNIFPDLQGGCNIVMQLSVSGQGVKIGYNKLFRAKKTCTTTEYSLDYNFNIQPTSQSYVAGNVYRLYYLKTDNQTISCGSSTNVFTVTQMRLIQNGFQEIDGGTSLYAISFPKGVTVHTTGNINATLLSSWEENYNGSVSAAYVKGYTVKEEVYDSIPYQRSSFDNPNYPGYNYNEPASLNKLNNFRDTILPAGFNSEYTLSGGANQIFATTIETSGGFVRLQQLSVMSATSDSFSIVCNASTKAGTVIGKGNFDAPPLISVDNSGRGLIYIKDNVVVPGTNVSFTRVSPVINGTSLTWGAMGKIIGTGIWGGSPFSTMEPYVSLDPNDGTALIAWTDTRNIGTTGYDIYIRHLDDLANPQYEPPYPKVRPAPNPYGPRTSSATLYGTTNQFTTLNVSGDSYSNDPGVSPAADISDNYNLGTVTLSMTDNTGPIRTNSGKPYLDRSYTITPQNNPNGAATITLRLFFTTAQFSALKAADPSIKTPGDLAVVKQPGTGSGTTYTVVAGEQTIVPQSWATVNGGFYIEIQVTSFSNFFILKNVNANLPVTWLGVQAAWANTAQAKVSWQVATQDNVASYTVQRSENGLNFSNICTMPATTQTQYSCLVSASSNDYFRILQKDFDDKFSYSKLVQLNGLVSAVLLFPNPAHDALYITGIRQTTTAQVIDIKGQILQQKSITPGYCLLDISKLSKGSYLLKLKTNDRIQTFKFIKQ